VCTTRKDTNVNELEKIDKIARRLEDISYTVSEMLDGQDSDYKNLDEVITYLDTIIAVLPQKSLYYFERIM
jgi:hypothetical protein